MSDTFYKRSQGAVWLQPDGPNTSYFFLPCAGMEGFSKSEGDLTLLYCKDEGRSGKFRVRDSIQGVSSPVTGSFAIPLGKLTNYVFGLNCKFSLQARYSSCERPDDPTGWEKIVHLSGARVTQRSSDALVARTPNDEGEVLTTVQFSAEEVFEVNVLTIERQSNAETNALNDIAVKSEARCADTCGAAQAAGETRYAVADRTGAASANVWRSVNNGGTWAVTAADPFAVSEDISSVVINGDRVIVARLTTDAGAPAEIAYSDDAGATWTTVNVGSTNGQTIQRLFWLSRPYLWAALSGGYIAFSSDAGVSWTVQDAGVATAQVLQDINFADSSTGVAVGAANACVKTLDGGTTWSAVTGPIAATILNAVEVLDSLNWWVAAADGNLYSTDDGGVTWTAAAISGAGSGQARDVRFFNSDFGFMLKNTAGPVGSVQQTIDGGKTWIVLTTPTNAGLNRLAIVDQNEVTAVGEVQGGTAVVLAID
jgi:photosystem II stability/assembly factor-like uncharacterized protein